MNSNFAKPHLALVVIATLTLSCNSSFRETSMSDSDSIKTSTITQKIDKTESASKNTIYTKRIPGITPLPFGEKAWPSERAKTKSNYLPSIRKVTYVTFGEQIGMTCLDSRRIDTLFKPATYKYRLPDIGIYESYYIDEVDNDFRNNCLNSTNGYQCLILYNKANKEAKVLNLHYDYYIDSVNSRKFYIDENYVIHLTDEQFTDDEPDSKGVVNGVLFGTYYQKVNILSDGTIKVTSGK